MRKVLILFVLLAGTAGAVFYLRSKNEPVSTSISTNVNASNVVERQQTAPAPEVVSLRDDVIAFIKIDVAQTARLAERINQFAASISGAPLWKRLGVGDRIVGDFMNGVTKSAADPEKAPEQARAAIETAIGIVSEIKTLMLVIAPASGEVPVQVMINLGVSGTKMRKFIDDNLKSMPYAEVEQQADGYKLKLRNPKMSDTPARIEYADNLVHIYFNASGAGDFSGNKTLKDSPKLALIGQSTLPNNFFQMFIDMDSVIKMLIAAIKLPAGEQANAEGLEKVKGIMEQQWKGLKAVSLSIAFNNGLESRQCVDLEGDSWISKLYNVFAAHATNKRTSSQFGSLIGPDTMGAIWMDGRGMQEIALAYIDLVQTNYRDFMNPANTKADMEQEVTASFEPMLKAAKDFVITYHPDEIGVLVRPSAGLPWPDFLIYYSDEKLSAVQMLAQIKELADKAGAPPQAAHFELSGEGANSQLKLVGAPVALPFVVAAFGERGVMLASGPGAVQVARAKLGQADVFAKNLGAQVAGQRLSALESDYYMLINSRRLFDLIRPYISILVAQAAQGGQQISVEEVSDMLSRLERQFISVQTMRMVSPGRYCAESAIEVTAAQ